MNVGVRSRGPFMETMPLSPGGQQPHSGVLSREAVAGPCINALYFYDFEAAPLS